MAYMYKEAFKFDLDTYTRKPAGPPSAACLVAIGMPQQRVHFQAFLMHGFSVLDIKPLMIVTN